MSFRLRIWVEPVAFFDGICSGFIDPIHPLHSQSIPLIPLISIFNMAPVHRVWAALLPLPFFFGEPCGILVGSLWDSIWDSISSISLMKCWVFWASFEIFPDFMTILRDSLGFFGILMGFFWGGGNCWRFL